MWAIRIQRAMEKYKWIVGWWRMYQYTVRVFQRAQQSDDKGKVGGQKKRQCVTQTGESWKAVIFQWRQRAAPASVCCKWSPQNTNRRWKLCFSSGSMTQFRELNSYFSLINLKMQFFKSGLASSSLECFVFVYLGPNTFLRKDFMPINVCLFVKKWMLV